MMDTFKNESFGETRQIKADKKIWHGKYNYEGKGYVNRMPQNRINKTVFVTWE